MTAAGCSSCARKSQATADAAALAAAETLFREYPQHYGLDVSGSAANAARSIAAANGFNNDGTTSVVNVRTAPETYSGGPNLGNPIPAGVAEVVVQYNQKRYFSSILGAGSIPVPARSVAAGSWKAADVAIHVLDLHRSGSLNATGESVITVTGEGNRQFRRARCGDKHRRHAFGTHLQHYGRVLRLRHQRELYRRHELRHAARAGSSSAHSRTRLGRGWEPGTILQRHADAQPRRYRGGISVSGKGTLNMEPGIYFMDGGGFSFSGQGDLNASGVMIFNAPTKSSDVVSITGTGSIIMRPPSEGIYKGLTLFQDRESPNTMTVSGGGYMDITGTFYAAGGTLKVGGGGDGRVGSQYISRFLEIVGNGGLRIDYNPAQAIPARTLHLIE